MALGNIGSDAESVAALAAMLKEDRAGNVDLRVTVAYALASMKPPAKAAIPRIARSMTETPPLGRRQPSL